MLGGREIAHILGRTGFGPYPGQVAAAADRFSTAEDLIDSRFDSVLPFEPRLTKAEPFRGNDPRPQIFVDEGPTVITGPDAPGAFDMDIIRDWWVNRMLLDEAGLHEKMMWAWHGIFTSSSDKAPRLNLLFQQLEILHRHALGSFRDLAIEIQTSGAMLKFLDGDTSKITPAPNENHARELMELFTLGVGEFSQKDVVAAAQVLAGWTAQTDPSAVIPDNHVTFHTEWGLTKPVTVLGVRGVQSVDDLVDVLLGRHACAPFVVGRLWDSIIGGPRDNAVIKKWADVFRSSKYDIGTLVRSMLHSKEFRAAIGTRPRSAIEWYCAAVRASGVHVPRLTARDLFRLGQAPYLPPNVAGWPHGTSWLASSRLRARMDFAAKLDVDFGGSLAGSGDVVEACLSRCSVIDVSPETRADLATLADTLAADPATSVPEREAAVLKAVLLSCEFAIS